MPMYDLIEYSDAYLKTSGIQYYRDEPALDNNGSIIDFPDNILIIVLHLYLHKKITRPTGNGGTKDEIMVPLKYLIKF